MDSKQINWLVSRGFSVQRLTDSARYMLVRADAVIYEDSGAGWLVKTFPAHSPEGYTLRYTNLRSLFEGNSAL